MNKLTLFPLCRGEYRSSQIYFIFDGILINAATTITSGFFMSGYMVALDAPDFLVGLINNCGTWALIISLFSYLVFERLERRKPLLIAMNITARLLICSIVYLPFFIKSSNAVLILTACMIIAGNLIWSIYSVGIMVWMVNLLSNDIKNRYIYLRMLCLRVSFTLFTLAMGLVLDMFSKSQAGFIIVFSVSLVLSLLDAIVLMKADEPLNTANKDLRFDVKSLLEPLRNREFRTYLLFIFCFYFSLNLSGSFTPLYQLRYLKLDYSFVSAINVICYVNMIFWTQFWNRIEVTKGLKAVLCMTALFIITEFLLYGFVTQNTVLLLFVTPFFAGIGNSGFNVATVTYRYTIIPEGQKTIYEGWYGAVFGLSALLAPVAGSFILDRLPNVNGAIISNKLQIMYVISYILSLTAIAAMFLKPRPGHRITGFFSRL